MSEPTGNSNINHWQLVMPPESARSLFQMLIASMVFSGAAIIISICTLVYASMVGERSAEAKTQAWLAENHYMQTQAELEAAEKVFGVKTEKSNAKSPR